MDEENSSKQAITVLWMWVTCVVAPYRSLFKKTKFSETFPEAAIREEGADELTLRADEVGTQRAFSNTV